MQSRTAKILNALLFASLLTATLGVQPAYAAAITVNSNQDDVDNLDGDCTLREAIIAANNNAVSGVPLGECAAGSSTADDTISFDANYTITLGSQLPPVIICTTCPNGTIIINGNGAANTIIQACDPLVPGDCPATDRVLWVNVGGNLTLDSLTIRNGRCVGACSLVNSDGGGILNTGTLTITNSTLSNNSAAFDGGGILNNGTVTINNSTLSGNRAGFNGGGISNNGAVTITNSTLSGNSANASAGGILNTGNAILTGSTLSGNSAGFTGGGFLNFSGSVATITNSTISGNSAGTDGGGISNINSAVTITNSTLSTNSAATDGGGIFNNGTVTLTDSTLSGNRALAIGGGIANNGGTVTLTSSTLSGGNFAHAGGGIANIAGTATLTNSTLSGNSAAFNGGGINNASTLTLTNSTISDNAAPFGGGIRNTGTLNYANTIIANSPAGGDCENLNLVVINTNNLVEDNSCSPSLSGDPHLGPLANNGGPTQTHALLTSPFVSPAIDAGDDAICAGAPNNQDQRGVARPQGAHCDIGAYELQVVVPTPTPIPTLPVPVTGGSLPNTGFAPNRITSLPAQPASLAYTALGDLWLEIPALNVRTSIVGIPKANNKWNVDWLGKDAGWLNGTAFPSWEGNSVLTGHVYDANGLPGPFAKLKDLKYGDQIIVHLYGEKYIFEIREVRTVQPASTRYALKHLEEYSYLTLITCQFYDEKTDAYLYRRIVRAVLVKVQAE